MPRQFDFHAARAHGGRSAKDVGTNASSQDLRLRRLAQTCKALFPVQQHKPFRKSPAKRVVFESTPLRRIYTNKNERARSCITQTEALSTVLYFRFRKAVSAHGDVSLFSPDLMTSACCGNPRSPRVSPLRRARSSGSCAPEVLRAHLRPAYS